MARSEFPTPARAGDLRAVGAVALAYTLLLALQAFCLASHGSPWVLDDAGFYFRYAESLAAGDGYRFNAVDAPVWGASAPLWPLLVALGVKAGAGAWAATIALSWALTLAATLLLGRVLQRVAGTWGVLALAPLVAFNYLYSHYATSALEMPLSYLLSAAALAVLVLDARGATLGLVAGLCLVHKLDFAPVGGALIVAAWAWRRPLAARATTVAAAVAVAWYGFALWHFGNVVPNSFLSKISATYGRMDTGWFATALFWKGGAPLVLALALVGLYALRARRDVVLVALAGCVPQTIAYTLKPPAENFEWYAAACAPSVAFLAACGTAWALRAALRLERRGSLVRPALAVAVLALLAWSLRALDRERLRRAQDYLSRVEPCFIDAGEWLAANTPPDATVCTGYGHVSYRSRRYVYDTSFLNRPREAGSLIHTYSPDWIVDAVSEPGQELPVHAGYLAPIEFVDPNGSFQVGVYGRRPPPEAPWLHDLLAEISDDRRAAVRRILLSGRDAEIPPELRGEILDAITRLRARRSASSSAAESPAWLAQLEARAALDGDELPGR